MYSEILSYKTVGSEGSSEFKDRGSKFIGFCIEVEDKEDIKQKLKNIKERHSKASHHCYAWRLGTQGIEFRSSDNGEPSGSAGRPIMRQIDSAGLTNVLVVVIRYFGGTLLGIPGLVTAYKTTAADCLANTTIVEREICLPISLSFDYTQMNSIMTLVKKFELKIAKQDMSLFCNFDLKVPLKNKEAFLTQIEKLVGVEVSKKN